MDGRQNLWSVLWVMLASTVMAGDWNAFRGPQGGGISTERPVPVRWGPENNIRWKTKLPQPGNGSAVCSGNQVFVVSALDEEGHRRSLLSFDRETGRQQWMRSVEFDKTELTHKTNPHCATTPAATDRQVVVWHGSAGLHCYDLRGKKLWSRDLGEFKHPWGYGASPVIHGDRVLLYCGPGERIFVIAIDVKTGETIWQCDESQEGDGQKNKEGRPMGSWATPVITKPKGNPQVLCSMPTRLVAYDLQRGDIIWSCDGLRGQNGDLVYSSPVASDDLCVVVGGYHGPGIGVRLGGQGNVTESHLLWRTTNNPQSIGSGVFWEGYFYRANAGPGTIECLDPETGEVLWSERAGGGDHWASIVGGGGLLYATNQQGTTVVFWPSPKEFELLAKNQLGETTNSTPAIATGQLFFRTFDHLVCVGIPKEQEPEVATEN